MMAHNQYMTEGAFERFFEAHTKSLRGEFHRIDDKIDKGFERMDQKFEAIDGKFDAIDGKFEAIDRKFEAIDGKFEAIDVKFEAINGKFHAVDHKISQNEARARNYRLARLHQKIQMITVLDTTSIKETIREPLIFPVTIRDFWKLRKKPAAMTYLLRFYNLSGWKSWDSYSSDLDSSDSESENSTSANSPSFEPSSQKSSSPCSFPQQPQTMEDAIDAHPELALQEIAEEIGLDYDRIESTVQAHKAYHAKQALIQAPLKRSTPPILVRDLSPKRQRRPSPPTPTPRFTVDDLIASQERRDNLPRSEPSVHTRVGWAPRDFRVVVGSQPLTTQPLSSQSVAGST